MASWFRLPDVATPRLGPLPLPTLLAIGGALAGLVIAVAGRRVAAVGARRRTAAARAALSIGVARVVDAEVIAPLNVELDAMARLGDAVRKFQR